MHRLIFLNLTPPFSYARFLDKNYTVWGEVVSGMENVDKIKRGEPVKDPERVVKATVS